MSATYTYTIYDANPSTSGSCSWPSHDDIEIEADSDEEAVDDVRSTLEAEAAGLSEADGYEEGQHLYANVWDADGSLIETVSYALTAEDLA